MRTVPRAQSQIDSERANRIQMDTDPMNKWHRSLAQTERDAVCSVFKFVDTESCGSLGTYGIREVMRILRLDTSGIAENIHCPLPFAAC